MRTGISSSEFSNSRREVVSCRCEDADAGGELVVGDDSRHGDKEAGSGGDEGFRDAGSDGAQSGGARGAETVECIDHAHYCAEEADERAGGGNGREPREALLQGSDGFAGRGLCGAFQWGEVFGWSGAAGLALVRFVDIDVDLREGAALVVVSKGGDLLQAGGSAEGINEVAALAGRLAEAAQFSKDDGPREEAGNEQHDQDSERDPSNVAHHFH